MKAGDLNDIAHCASASIGAVTYGIPNSSSRTLVSSSICASIVPSASRAYQNSLCFSTRPGQKSTKQRKTASKTRLPPFRLMQCRGLGIEIRRVPVGNGRKRSQKYKNNS